MSTINHSLCVERIQKLFDSILPRLEQEVQMYLKMGFTIDELTVMIDDDLFEKTISVQPSFLIKQTK